MTQQTTNHNAPVNRSPILLVEDDPDDAELTIRSLRRARLMNPVVRLSDANEALVLLQRQQYELATTDNPVSLVLLDLNLPGLDGRGLLGAIAGDRYLREIPVVILTGSELTNDRLRSYKRGALGFLRKPIQVPELLRLLGDLSGAGLYFVREAA